MSLRFLPPDANVGRIRPFPMVRADPALVAPLYGAPPSRRGSQPVTIPSVIGYSESNGISALKRHLPSASRRVDGWRQPHRRHCGRNRPGSGCCGYPPERPLFALERSIAVVLLPHPSHRWNVSFPRQRPASGPSQIPNQPFRVRGDRSYFRNSFDSFDAVLICVDQLAEAHVGEGYLMRFITPGKATHEQLDQLKHVGLVNGEALDPE